jgi:putative ABC transport system permease protein
MRQVRYAVRSLGRTPAATVLAILSVTLGIGASTAAYTLLRALLFRPLEGVERPGELAPLNAALPSTILDGLERDAAFAGACGFSTPLLTTEAAGRAEPVGTLALTGECSATLGVRAQLGRVLASSDDEPGSPAVAVITDHFWRARFGSRPDGLGKEIPVARDRAAIPGTVARLSGRRDVRGAP